MSCPEKNKKEHKKMELKKVKLHNEKGNVSVKVRDGIRAQIDNKLENALFTEFGDIERNANGGYSCPIGIDEISGETIYANFSFTVSTASPNAKKEKKPKAKAETNEVVVPDLF